MKARRRPLVQAGLLWFGVFGAASAWTLQHLSGYILSEATCDEAGREWNVHSDTWTLAITGLAAATACAAGIAALLTFRANRDADDDSPPPDGRYYFLSIIGMTITPLFLAMILMSGLGSALLTGCRQS
jgi:Mn2+/Fe2+ NRAMP family transporter